MKVPLEQSAGSRSGTAGPFCAPAARARAVRSPAAVVIAYRRAGFTVLFFRGGVPGWTVAVLAVGPRGGDAESWPDGQSAEGGAVVCIGGERPGAGATVGCAVFTGGSAVVVTCWWSVVL